MRDASSIAVVGAGPAGLAAACAVAQAGFRVTLYDAGKQLHHRHHDWAEDLGIGVGGAGLFSDGKFSYYPSGTNLYRLADADKLARAYEWCVSQLREVGIGVAPFPTASQLTAPPGNRSRVKEYPSYYASLDQRRALVERLLGHAGGAVVTNSIVREIRRASHGYEISVEFPSALSEKKSVSAIVLATGRFGGLDIQEGTVRGAIPLKLQRFDLGIRVETHSSVGFLNRLNAPDVKYLWQNEHAEIRTFCTCRNGEIWRIPCTALSAISGRADGCPTEFSNFGLLVRLQGADLDRAGRLWTRLRNSALSDGVVTFEPIAAFLGEGEWPADFDPGRRPWFPRHAFQRGRIRERLDPELYEIIAAAVRNLVSWSPDVMDSRTVCLFPAIEGVGYYPDIDCDLRVRGHCVWCAGDVVGKFRGLIPSLVSGYYAGLSTTEAVAANVEASSLALGMT